MWDGGLTDEQIASSPDQVAVCWNNTGEVIAASPASGNVPNSYDMDITRMPADFNVQAALNMRREKSLDVPPLTAGTLFLTAVSGYNERTRILALDGRTSALSDDDLAEWLVEAERQMTLGTDNHPIFETALQDTACAISRLPNGQIAMTEVPRQFIENARDKVRPLTGNQNIFNLAIETPLRCAARYFLTASPEGASALRPEKESEVTAFLIINKSGYNFGLWSPAAGLFSEYAFPAPSEFVPQGSGGFYRFDAQTRDVRILDPQTGREKNEPDEAGETNNLDAYIYQAFDQLFIQLSPEKLEQLQLSGYSQIVWAAEIALADKISKIASDYAKKTGLDFYQIGVPADEAVAGGLLFGSFNFGDEAVAGAEILPPVNVGRDLLVLADTEEIERRRFEEANIQKRRSRAVFALTAVPVVVLAILTAMVADLIRQQLMLGFREVRAEMRTAELKPALERRNSYEANLKWYQEFIKQVSYLRRQQPVGTGMLYELNPSYPFAADPSFYISELKLLPTGGVEIKGLARSKDAVTAFLRALEFSGGAQSGTRLFNNLTYEVQEGVAQTAPTAAAQPNLPAMTGSNLGATKPAPGVIVWSIKGNYVPMAAFTPPDPKTQPPKSGQPNPPNAAPNQQNPAANAPKTN